MSPTSSRTIHSRSSVLSHPFPSWGR
jgi:hypothetical protein